MKIQRKIYTFLLLMMIVPFAFAQKSDKKAVDIITKTVNLLANNSIETNFGMAVLESGSKEMQKMKGTFILNGNKFVLKMEGMSVFFDGKTQWSYIQEYNEVSITNPTEKELAETNPMALLQGYKEKSAIRFTKQNIRPNAYGIELIPKSANESIKKIVVQVNKTNFHPLSIQLIDKNGLISTLALSNFKVGVPTTDSTFVFDKSKYTNVEVNDLR